MYDIPWSIYNPAHGFIKAVYSKGRTIFIHPDMDRQRYYWTVVWAGEKSKFDKKKGELVPERPAAKAWGISDSLQQAKIDAIERVQKPRPRERVEYTEEGTLSL